MYVFGYEDNGNFRTAVIHMNITRGESLTRKSCKILMTHFN